MRQRVAWLMAGLADELVEPCGETSASIGTWSAASDGRLAAGLGGSMSESRGPVCGSRSAR